jgi:uncharacterized SAM-binding protein YcdF (DUF218 family)
MSVFVVFGARVYPDRRPSPALLRRTEAAWVAGGADADSVYLVTGTGPETEAMTAALAMRDVPANRIVKESASPDTLSSVVNCAAIVRGKPVQGRLIVSTDRYHQPRCRWLFRLLGIQTEACSIPSGLGDNGLIKWTWFWIREVPAIIVDTVLIALRKHDG